MKKNKRADLCDASAARLLRVNRKELLLSLLLSALLAVGALIAAFAYTGKYPFGEASLSVSDLNTQYLDFLTFEKNHSFAERLYSFSKGLGGATVGLHAYYTLSPIRQLAGLLLPAHAEAAMLLMRLAYSALLAVSACFYLDCHYEKWQLNVVCALLYACFPFFIRYYFNLLWMDAFAALPLLVLGTEQLLENGRRGIFLLAYLFSILTSYYVAYMSSLFILLYFFYYAVAFCRSDGKMLLKRIGTIALCVGICLLITLPLTLPSVLETLNSKTVTGSVLDVGNGPAYNLQMTLISLFDGVYMYDAYPVLFGSTLTVCLTVCYYCSKAIPRRERAVSLLMMAILLLSLISKPLNLIWHGFTRPEGFPFRFLFCFAFFTVLLCRRALEHFRLADIRPGLAGVIGLYMLACWWGLRHDYLPWGRYSIPLTCAAVLAFLLFAVCSGRFPGRAVAALCLALTLETVFQTVLFLNAQMRVDGEGNIYRQGEYSENAARVAAALQTIGDDGFYRLEDEAARPYNQSMGQRYYGIGFFASGFSPEQLRLCEKIGYGTWGIYAMWYESGNVLSDSLIGLKYILSDGAGPAYCELVSSGEKNVYYNPYYLPILYTGSTDQIPTTDENGAELTGAAWADEVFRTLCGGSALRADGSVDLQKLAAYTAQLRKTACTVEKQDGAVLKCRAEGEYLLSSVPFDTGWRVWVNGKRVQPQRYLQYFLSAPLEPGENTVKMFYLPQGFVPAAVSCAVGVVLLFIWVWTDRKRKRV